MVTAVQVHDALVAAAEPHNLLVDPPDAALGGAAVKGRKIQAYVYPVKDGTFVVEVWRPRARDAEPVRDIGSLKKAVEVAVQCALGNTAQPVLSGDAAG